MRLGPGGLRGLSLASAPFMQEVRRTAPSTPQAVELAASCRRGLRPPATPLPLSPPQPERHTRALTCAGREPRTPPGGKTAHRHAVRPGRLGIQLHSDEGAARERPLPVPDAFCADILASAPSQQRWRPPAARQRCPSPTLRRSPLCRAYRLQSLYRIKGREAEKPLAICVADVEVRHNTPPLAVMPRVLVPRPRLRARRAPLSTVFWGAPPSISSGRRACVPLRRRHVGAHTAPQSHNAPTWC